MKFENGEVWPDIHNLRDHANTDRMGTSRADKREGTAYSRAVSTNLEKLTARVKSVPSRAAINGVAVRHPGISAAVLAAVSLLIAT